MNKTEHLELIKAYCAKKLDLAAYPLTLIQS